MTGESNKFIKATQLIVLRIDCANSKRFPDCLYSGLRCQLFSNGDHGPPKSN